MAVTVTAAAPVVATAATQPTEPLSDRLGIAVARSVQQMAAESEQALRTKNATKGVFYPVDLIHLLEDLRNQGSWQANLLLEGARRQGFFIDGWVNPNYFDPIDVAHGQTRCFRFIAKDEVTATAALKAAKTGLRILDCGAVCQIALYDALLQQIGSDKFDKLFSNKHGQKLNIGFRDDDLQPMRYFCRFTDAAIQQIPGEVGHRNVRVGDVVSFNGVKDYRKKHPNEMGANYNVVCIDATPGSQKYVGHGLPAEGATEEQIAALMVDEYNKEPDHFSRVPLEGIPMLMALLKMRDLLSTGNLEHHKVEAAQPLTRVSGFDIGSPMALRADVVAALVERPLHQVSMDFVRTHFPLQAQGDDNKGAPLLETDHKDND